MDHSDRFWLGIWALIAGVILALIVCGFGDDAYTTSQVRLMLHDGVNPAQVYCTLHGASSGPDCNLIWSKGK